MLTARTRLIKDLFSFLEDHQYVALKYLLEQAADLPLESDFDLLLSPSSSEAVIRFCQDYPLMLRTRLEALHHGTMLHLYFADGGYLKLDLLSALTRKGVVYLTEDYIKRHRRTVNGVTTYAPQLLLEHVLLFNFLNKSGIPDKYLAYFAHLPANDKQILCRFLNRKYGLSINALEDLGTYTPSVHQQLTAYLSQQPENQPWRRLSRYTQFLWNRIKDSRPRKGKMISFSGVDGVGKSTLLNDLAMVLAQEHKEKVIVLRHRPGIFPILSAWRYGREKAEAKTVARLPRTGTNTSKIGSWTRFSYYFLDYLMGQIWIRIRYSALNYTVIYDRYYYDFIVDSKRSNINLAPTWPKRLLGFIAKPDLNFFLYASPETILTRKQELSSETIEELTLGYQELFNELGLRYQNAFHCILNDDRERSLRIMRQWYNQTI